LIIADRQARHGEPATCIRGAPGDDARTGVHDDDLCAGQYGAGPIRYQAADGRGRCELRATQRPAQCEQKKAYMEGCEERGISGNWLLLTSAGWLHCLPSFHVRLSQLREAGNAEECYCKTSGAVNRLLMIGIGQHRLEPISGASKEPLRSTPALDRRSS